MVLVHLPGFGMPLGLPVAFARPRISQALSGQYFALPLQRIEGALLVERMESELHG